MIKTLSTAGQAALENVRAVEMSRFFGAPASARTLADLGGDALIEDAAEFKDAKVG